MNAKSGGKKTLLWMFFVLVGLLVLSYYIGRERPFEFRYVHITNLRGANSTKRVPKTLRAEHMNPSGSFAREQSVVVKEKNVSINTERSQIKGRYKLLKPSINQSKEKLCGHEWQERYKQAHEEDLRSRKNTKKFLVYFCPGDYLGCCGYGNRLRAVVSLFYLSILTNRTFLIDWRTPEPISNYLHPHQIQWNHTVRGLEMRGHYWGSAGAQMRRMAGWDVKGTNGTSFAKWFKNTNFFNYFKKPVEVITTIWYFADEGIKSNQYLMKRARSLGITPLISNVPDLSVIGCAFRFLFTKSVTLENYLLRWKKHFSKKLPTIGIHIRTGDHQFDDRKPLNNRLKNFTKMFQCALKVEKEVFRIDKRFSNHSQWFLATDNDIVKKYAIKNFPFRTIITTNFTPFHLDVRNYSLLWCNNTIHEEGIARCNYTTNCDSSECLSKFYVNRTFDSNWTVPFNLSSKFAQGILGMLVDSFLLSQCDYLILCDSSFSSTAVGLSMRTVNTYTLGDQGCVIRRKGKKQNLRYYGYLTQKKK